MVANFFNQKKKKKEFEGSNLLTKLLNSEFFEFEKKREKNT